MTKNSVYAVLIGASAFFLGNLAYAEYVKRNTPTSG